MNKIYFMERLAELSHIAILVYNKKTEQVVQQYGYVEKMQELFENDKDVLFHMSDENIKEYPLICAVNENQLIGVIWDKTSDEEVILAGPVKIGMTRLEAFVSCILLLFAQITGKELTLAEFWEGNKEQYQKVGQIQERISEDIFIRQENFGPHNPYEKELRELDSIRNGDKESLRKSLSETYEGEYGILAKNPLRQHQNLAIIEIAFASRAAIQGGVSVEKSFSMTDSFVQQIEEMDNIQEVEILKLEAQYAFASAVQEEQIHGKQHAERNPLIDEVKNYIFQNMHSTIRVADIAAHFHVNADYLSHLFSTCENVTIKQYILQEKIKLSQNLLKYSEYHIQEIGFYLGFSSQSHFTKVFQQISGMNPKEYRKQYGNREKWKKK